MFQSMLSRPRLNMWLRFLVILTVIFTSHGDKKKGQDPLKLSATDTEMLWLKDDGSYK